MSAPIAPSADAQRTAGRDAAPSPHAEHRVAVMAAAVSYRPLVRSGSGERSPDAPVPVLGAEGAQDREGWRDPGATGYHLYLELI